MYCTKNSEKGLLSIIIACCYACSLAIFAASAYALMVFTTSAMVNVGQDIQLILWRY